MDALIDGEAGNLTQVMVGMSPDGTDPVGAEGYALRIATIYLIKSLFAIHHHLSYIYRTHFILYTRYA